MTSDSGLTGTGQFVGTLDYAAPEQFEGKPLDRAWLSSREVHRGGTLTFTLGMRPNKDWASSPSAAPPALSR